MILGEIEFTGYQTTDGNWVSSSEVKENEANEPVLGNQLLTRCKLDAEQVEKRGDLFVLRDRPEIRVESRAHKMSKSRGNVVNPDMIVREFGADSLRLYEMFMGPLEQVKPWSMAGVSGVRGFLDRVWRMVVDERSESLVLNAAVQRVPPTDEQNRMIHRTIQAVTRDLERMEFNTAIARMMEFVNFFTKESVRPLEGMESFVLLLSPFAPHLGEELWHLLGHTSSLAYEPWPQYVEALTVDSTIEVPVQVCGKLRSKVSVPADCSPADLEAAANADPRIAEWIQGKQLIKTVVVPGRLVNFVVK